MILTSPSIFVTFYTWKDSIRKTKVKILVDSFYVQRNLVLASTEPGFSTAQKLAILLHSEKWKVMKRKSLKWWMKNNFLFFWQWDRHYLKPTKVWYFLPIKLFSKLSGSIENTINLWLISVLYSWLCDAV